MHCNREEFVSIAKPDCRFSHTLAVYLLRGLLFTKTLRLFVNRLRNVPKALATAPKARAVGTVVLHLEFASRVRVRGQNFLKGAFGGPSANGGLRPGYPLAVQL